MMNNTGMTMNRGDMRVFAKSDGSGRQSLPLPSGYFTKKRLSANAMHEFESVAAALLENALDRSRKERIYGGVDESWRDIGAMNGFKRHTKTEGATQHYRVQGVVRAPMVNVMSVVYAEHDAAIVQRRNDIYGSGLDAQTLHVLRERTPTDRHQHLSLVWEASNIITATEAYKYDSCALEYTGITIDLEHQPIGFKIAHSIDLPQCGSLRSSHGLQRMEGTETMLLRPTSNNTYTEIVIEGSFELDDKLPHTAMSIFLSAITVNLNRVPQIIQSRRLAAMKVLDKSMWVPANERKNCSVCLSRFGMLGKKHHCRSCGEVVCKSCVVSREGKTDCKFCKKCVVVACSEDELVLPPRSNHSHTSHSSTRSHTSSHSRDSYASSMNRWSEADRLSASVFIPPQQPIKARNDIKFVEDLKHLRDENSMTASETSYDSTYRSSGFIESASNYDGEYRPRPEDSMIFLDTKSMMRTNNDPYNNGRGYGPPPTMQEVEDSLAHQRHILKEMLSQASRAYRPNAPVKTN